jgi:lipopolysaccharide transport system ATP-binding protein
LAFAVAAHLEPEILLVDEVLAVGDLEFQKKCLGKMEEVSRSGRTVLFVSHNMEAIRRLCKTIIVLDKGLVIFKGKTEEGIRVYLKLIEDKQTQLNPHQIIHDISDGVKFLSIELLDNNNEHKESFYENEPIIIRVRYWALCRIRQGIIGFRIVAEDGSLVFVSHWNDTGSCPDINPGIHEARATIPPRLLMPGRYFIWLGAVDSSFKALAATREVATFEVVAESDPNKPFDHRPGYIRPPVIWDV